MSSCKCNNSVFWDGIRYCPDCNTHAAAPTRDDLTEMFGLEWVDYIEEIEDGIN